jgi:3'-phosphoadenosine 5'-phosphosulfate sulfotransferase (PAPS reductase)/FAD synthetase
MEDATPVIAHDTLYLLLETVKLADRFTRQMGHYTQSRAEFQKHAGIAKLSKPSIDFIRKAGHEDIAETIVIEVPKVSEVSPRAAQLRTRSRRRDCTFI